ncbi:MAG: phenylalanine--tRNA ligase subunit alpha [Ignavibacteria bacterium GWF2_33_9]|nr:MAG: phenylalanine--tRNA ligase subunit alpha [Ignavibacteria bacterium GWF2_33_9]
MLEEVPILKKEIEEKLSLITDSKGLEAFRLEYLVKKGKVQVLFDRMKEAPKDQKPILGKELNILRKFVENAFAELKEKFESAEAVQPTIDLTLPGRTSSIGSAHPVYQTMDQMINIFTEMGFSIAEGPDVEDDAHNFDALNFPPDHPARDMQDTFFIKNGENLLLRTHTSPVQIRVMQGMKPPIRSIMPGRVYRNESINARSLAEFHQIEGLYIDKNVSFAELKATMMVFAKKMYGENSKFRFRPSFFPFTEPSAEMDITCFLCGGKGCRVCKQSGWLEIVGCGMVHPNVLRNGGIDPSVYSGYAFGFGIERVSLLKTGVDDIRLLYENDTRFLNQF